MNLYHPSVNSLLPYQGPPVIGPLRDDWNDGHATDARAIKLVFSSSLPWVNGSILSRER